jgi:hypothetical protein
VSFNTYASVGQVSASEQIDMSDFIREFHRDAELDGQYVRFGPG